MDRPETPMLDKMLKVQQESQIISEFIEYVQNKEGYSLSKWVKDRDFYVGGYMQTLGDREINDLMGEFFGIDTEVAEQERSALLDYVRSTQG